jgi:hypothetical protein
METQRLHALYPDLSDTELETAKHNLEEFVAFIAEICEAREAKAQQESETHNFDREELAP